MFDQTMENADSFIVKLPITFPCLLIGIILSQYLEIIKPQEIPSKKFRPMTLDNKQFVGKRVQDIMVPQHQTQAAGGSSALISKSTINNVLLELMEESKSLQDTITSSTIRKKKIDALISLIKKEDGAVESNKEEQSESKSEDKEKAHYEEKEEEQFTSAKDIDSLSFSSEEESSSKD